MGFIKSHEDTLWWLHSLWALLFGVFVMWLGSRDFTYLRIIIFHIAFIWLSSLFLPAIAKIPRFAPQWRERLRLAVNYFNKNFYQQLIFFVMPIYYASATWWSRNMAFMALLAVSAVLSTLDIVYDRYLSVRWPLTSLFFAFNLFACINVLLPLIWNISNHRAVWISGALALAAFCSLFYRYSGLRGRDFGLVAGAAAIVLLAVIFLFRPFLPPAPLSLAGVEFGRSIRALKVVSPIAELPAGGSGDIVALSAIKAPLGLREEVRHRWYLDGKLLYSSPVYSVTGGRQEGYRVWTRVTWRQGLEGSVLVLDVETRSGQLIGRATLKK